MLHRFKPYAHVLLFIAITMSTSFVKSQHVYYKHFTTSNGLPSNTIYSIIEDKNGFIWVSTDQGVSRFDGIKFKNFSTADGLPDNDVINIVEDSTGRIWFMHFAAEPAYWYKGKIYNSNNDSFLNLLKKNRQYNRIKYAISILSNTLYFGLNSKHGNKFVNMEDKREVVLENYPADEGLSPFYFYFQGTETIVIDPTSVAIIKNKKLQLISSHYRVLFSTYNPRTNRIGIYNYLNKSGGYIDPSLKRTVILPKKDVIYYNHDQNRKNYFLLKDKIVIESSEYSNGIKELQLDFSQNISRMIVAKSGAIWLISNFKGLYYIPPSYNALIPGTENILSISLLHTPEALYIGTNGSGMIKKNTNSIFENLNFIRNTQESHRIRGMVKQGEYLFLGTDFGVMQFHRKTKQFNRLLNNSVKDIELGYGKEILVATASGVFQINGQKTKSIYASRTTSVCRIDKNTIWIGRLDGLVEIKQNLDSFYSKKVNSQCELDNSFIRDISIDQLGNTWIATNQNGIYFYDQRKYYSMNNIIKKDWIKQSARKIYIDSQNNIWIATALGLIQIVYKIKNKIPEFSATLLNHTYGLPDNDIHDILRSGNKIILATSSGCYEYQPHYLNPFQSKTIIHEILVNGIPFSPNSLILKHTENNIIVNFDASFIQANAVQYNFRYRVLGLTDNWTEIHTNQIPLLGLPPGNYELQIYAYSLEDENGLVTHMNFTIKSAWYTRWWFITIVSLALLAILFWLLNKERKRLKTEGMLKNMELKVLRGQMNPHFIFNSLTSIQQNLVSKDFESSSKYISRFAKLLRNNLHFSALEHITLKEEIDFLENYLSLEIFRFHNLFTFNIQVLNVGSREDIKLPAFMVQPLIENSIKHGFKFKKSGGEISIVFEQLNTQLLKVTVSNNGVSLPADFRIGSHFKKSGSVALAIIAQRIELLKQKTRIKELSFNIMNAENGMGTISTLILPITEEE